MKKRYKIYFEVIKETKAKKQTIYTVQRTGVIGYFDTIQECCENWARVILSSAHQKKIHYKITKINEIKPIPHTVQDRKRKNTRCKNNV